MRSWRTADSRQPEQEHAWRLGGCSASCSGGVRPRYLWLATSITAPGLSGVLAAEPVADLVAGTLIQPGLARPVRPDMRRIVQARRLDELARRHAGDDHPYVPPREVAQPSGDRHRRVWPAGPPRATAPRVVGPLAIEHWCQVPDGEVAEHPVPVRRRVWAVRPVLGVHQWVDATQPVRPRLAERRPHGRAFHPQQVPAAVLADRPGDLLHPVEMCAVTPAAVAPKQPATDLPRLVEQVEDHGRAF